MLAFRTNDHVERLGANPSRVARGRLPQIASIVVGRFRGSRIVNEVVRVQSGVYGLKLTRWLAKIEKAAEIAVRRVENSALILS
jgi:hypothetical protein